MLRITLKNTALALFAFASVTAQAALTTTSPLCNTANLTPTATGCGGSFAGNNTNQLADISAFSLSKGWGSLSYLGSSNDAGFGPFTSNPQTTSGTLSFDTAQTGPFVLSLKAGNQFSLYYFDATNLAVSSIGFSTLGTNLNVQGRPQDLSHASVYGVAAIPEPETYALMMAGLGAMGFVARRRRKS